MEIKEEPGSDVDEGICRCPGFELKEPEVTEP
jgi:hypothetical protein